MAYNTGYGGYGANPSSNPSSSAAQNLQFYASSYGDPTGRVSGHTTPAQGAYANYGMSGMSQSFGGVGPVGGQDPNRQLQPGLLAAFGTGGYDDEPPLLEELGINFGHIKMKTLIVLNPLASIDQHIMDDSDLAGPILFCFLFGTFLLLSGRVHFGYIYGCAFFGSLTLHWILNLMALPGININYIRSASVLGYCLLPLVFVSFFGVAFPMDGMVGFAITSVAIGWCTYSSSAMFVAVLRVRDMRLLVAYPLALFYCVFGIMSIFSSRGGGAGQQQQQLANAATKIAKAVEGARGA
ncbi:hypothetical protein TWF569_006106 [Orbilia oligospora]|uniref:Protein YIP n=1 Tax=Orbilia oligospora TaxID=2813651 RepID=A0A7C8K4C7_ORBOL|nr:hypothetical protein TWF102_003443 [Orbilia oligospora]KAF3104736.1 hypothetical protein TWF706_004516 [Orbilia oligospora]KAF3115434.1 hypothetical protein TWF103_010856 [Orbilia oligospora]KAF3131024.1 hypothetical protein TWF703_008018 [Orbilia oligospora]KAF3139757.1 hypothetical protein TWF594_006616 [Orbilia oligospora]